MEIAEARRSVAEQHPEFGYLAAIADSVLAERADAHLAVCGAMFDIIVVARPIPVPPYEVVRVRAPNSLDPPKPGRVVIEHESLSGRNDVIERPVAEAVPLFWVFVREKFGVVRARH